VSLILRNIPGVAHTTGSDLDDDLKEIHFSLNYIAGITPSRRAEEIRGVVTHELVHCYQYNGREGCPSGLVEGVADWVRLKCGLCPPHWRREREGRWDGGYQHTGYFLEYLCDRFGGDSVRRMNEKLRVEEYDGERFWMELFARPVERLWEDYGEKLREEELVIVDKEDLSEGSRTC
jgi:hypothetical protein